MTAHTSGMKHAILSPYSRPLYASVVRIRLLIFLFICLILPCSFVELAFAQPSKSFTTLPDNSGELPVLPEPPEVAPSADVGLFKGDLQATQNGEAIYNLNLWTPPGRAGMQPTLVMTYKSRAATGYFGPRWSFSSPFSSISRCGSNYAYDNEVRRVAFDSLDHFCIDGKRLNALEPGTSGHDGARYATDKDSFVRITSHGDGPDYFIVETKEGRIITYGYNDSDPIEADEAGRSSVLHAPSGVEKHWAVRKIEDRRGNYMAFGYFVASHDASIYPTYILYTGFSKGADQEPPKRWVRFFYDTSLDNVHYSYSAGALGSRPPLMSDIIVGIDFTGDWYDLSGAVRSYHFEYSAAEPAKVNLLMSITETDMYGISKPPIRFDWQTNEEGYLPAQSTGIPVPQSAWSTFSTSYASSPWNIPHKPIPIDINGDGFMDLVYPRRDFRFRILMNGGEEYYETHGHWGFLDEQTTEIYAMDPSTFPMLGSDQYVGAKPIDYNLDGLTDLFLMLSTGEYQVVCSTGESFEYCGTGISIGHNPEIGDYIEGSAVGYEGDRARNLHLVDLNGDGLQDMLILYGQMAGEPAYGLYRIRTPEGFGEERILDIGSETHPAFFLHLDYNGDGAIDVLHTTTKVSCPGECPYKVVYFHEGEPRMEDTNLPRFSGHAQKRIADLNGDGLQDIIVAHIVREGDICEDPDICRYLIRAWINTGEGFIGGTDGIPVLETAVPDADGVERHYKYFNRIAIFDYDGDGINDMLIPNIEYDPEMHPPLADRRDSDGNLIYELGSWKLCRGTGAMVTDTTYNFLFDPPEDIDLPFVSKDYFIQPPLVMDLNGDLQPDLLTLQNNSECGEMVDGIAVHDFTMHIHRGKNPNVITEIRESNICGYRTIVITDIVLSWTAISGMMDSDIGHRGQRYRA
ncbi:MAG: VCBS repeat-containing protein [Proteobacteria bacterium]|nr:VCBS repeat-containing protein [Pseudomonadota bacterium]